MRFRPQAGKSEEEEGDASSVNRVMIALVYAVLLALNTTANIQTWVQYQF